MVIYGTQGRIFPLLALLHVWWRSAVICWMMYNQNLDIQVWKLHDVENGKYGNKIKLMEIVGEFNGKKVNQKEEKAEGKSLIRYSPE